MGALADAPRPGAARTITDDQVEALVTRALTERGPGQDSHWSTRTMAAETGLPQSSVFRIWRAFGLKPHAAHHPLRTLVPSSSLMPLLAFRWCHRYRARRGASVWHAWHAWRDPLPGEIFFGQAAPAGVTREARESLAGEPTESADERPGHPNVQAAPPQPPITPHIPAYPSLC